MPYRNKTYVCFDGDNDIHYYYLMRAWKRNDGFSFNFFDAHDLNVARDTSLSDSIRHQLRKRLLNSKVLVVLVGERTRYLYKFVRWEMEQALDLDMPIIAVNLNGLRVVDRDLCPPIIKDELVKHVSFNAAILQYAIEKWPGRHRERRGRCETGPSHYATAVYRRLALV